MTIPNHPMRAAAKNRRVVQLLALLLISTLTLASRSFAEEPASTLIDGRYLVQSDGETVKDTRTGLTWMRCSVGQKWDGTDCQGSPERVTLAGATTRAADFSKGNGYAGDTRWRLPTGDELGGLLICFHNAEVVQANCPAQPAGTSASIVAFPGIPDRPYWTSSRASDGSPVSILFDTAPMYGFSDPGDGLYLRLVR